MKIYQHLRLHIKILSWRLHIMILFTFWNIHTRGIWNVCSQTYRNNRISKKLACFLRNIQTSRVNNSRIFRFKNAEFSRNCFHMEPSIWWNFQIFISVPFTLLVKAFFFFWRVPGYYAMPPSKFEIFLIFSNFQWC